LQQKGGAPEGLRRLDAGRRDQPLGGVSLSVLLREPCDASPPLRPAWAARLRSWEKLRFSLGTLAPPLRAISR